MIFGLDIPKHHIFTKQQYIFTLHTHQHRRPATCPADAARGRAAFKEVHAYETLAIRVAGRAPAPGLSMTRTAFWRGRARSGPRVLSPTTWAACARAAKSHPLESQAAQRGVAR